MKSLVIAGLMALAASAQATNVGVSIGISQPGVYGRVDIGRFPQPAVVVAQPVLVQAPRMVVAQPIEPVYLWVPPGHRRHWHRHCAQYNACGVPVMFVQDRWYRDHVYRDPVYGGHAAAAPRPAQYVVREPVFVPDRGRGGETGREHGRGHGRGYERAHDRPHGRD